MNSILLGLLICEFTYASVRSNAVADSISVWITRPYLVIYSDSLLNSVAPNQPMVMARATAMQAGDTSIILIRSIVKKWKKVKQESLIAHERFHFVKLPHSVNPFREALANWYSFQMGFTPEEPTGSAEIGLASGWFAPFPQLKYAWWVVFAQMPDTTVINWIQYGTPIDSTTVRNAIEASAHCFAGDIKRCPIETRPLKGAKPPKQPPSRSIHILNKQKCPAELPVGALCTPGSGKYKAVMWVY